MKSHVNKGLFTSASQHWATPRKLYAALDKEFHFDCDPAPLEYAGADICDSKHGGVVFL